MEEKAPKAVPKLPSKQAPSTPESQDDRVVNADELFRGGREVCIDHAGVLYRLRITRRNKLILQK